MPNRIYCPECKKFFIKQKTGFEVAVNPNSTPVVYVRGDLYECSGCAKIVYGDFGQPFEKRVTRDPETE